MYEEVPGYNNRTKFFSEFNPDFIEDSLKVYFSQNAVNPQYSDHKYEIEFTIKSKFSLFLEDHSEDDIDEQEKFAEYTEICIRILKVNEKLACVEFSKLNGTSENFYQHFQEIKKVCLNLQDSEENLKI